MTVFAVIKRFPPAFVLHEQINSNEVQYERIS